jgi:hypothetical protein
LTPAQAVFGCEGISPLDLGRASSLGGLKRDWVDVENKQLKPELLSMVERRIQMLRSGEWELPVVDSALKNELRPISKVVEG